MNTSMRARRDALGFSMVELLVTIIIAGIAFSALVPLFVMANKKNSGDNLRVQSMQVAQDKIEKIRQLPYGSIAADKDHPTTVPNLYNGSKLPLPDDTWAWAFADGQFGPTATLSSGNGTRVIRLNYTVKPFPATTTGLQSEYKIVTVDAYWDAPPTPVKHAVLSTIVYRQYAGPPISSMYLTPSLSASGVLGSVTSTLYSVLIQAHVDLAAGVTPAYLQFSISGPVSASQKVLLTDTDSGSSYWYGGSGNFFWRWSCGTAPNEGYDFYATAFSSEGFVGNTFHLFPILSHILSPSPPRDVVANPGNARVYLTWKASLEPTTSSYEVYRSLDASGLWDATNLIETTSATTLSYTDTTGLSNDGTGYYYAVKALTTTLVSDPALSDEVVPTLSTDVTPPTQPTNLTATTAPGSSTITLSWTASTDPGVDAATSGVKLYEIWRSAAASGPWNAMLATSTSTPYADVTAGLGQTWYYKVRAMDNVSLLGSFSDVKSATTGSFPKHNLKISVPATGNNKCYVWVLYASPGPPFWKHYFGPTGLDLGSTAVSPGTEIKNSSFVLFQGLPDGDYTVWTNQSSTFDISTNKLQNGPSLNGADNLTYVVTP